MKAKLLITLLIAFTYAHHVQAQNGDIDFEINRNTDNTLDIKYNKHFPGTIYVQLTLTALENCTQPRVIQKVIKNNCGTYIKLRPSNAEQPINLQYQVRYVEGDPHPQVDELFQYVLPFQKGQSVGIIETVSVREKYFDAEKDLNWVSYIADRTAADTVCAMRKGKVISIVKEHMRDTFDGYEFNSEMNTITVEHRDGTFATYKGLQLTSMLVHVGQTVYPQTKLGTLELFNNSTYRLYFSINYFSGYDCTAEANKKMSSTSSLKHLRPLFYSPSGVKVLSPHDLYTVDCSEDIFLEEFTRREKKNYNKNKLNYK